VNVPPMPLGVSQTGVSWVMVIAIARLLFL
jgi:hypothetical protein